MQDSLKLKDYDSAINCTNKNKISSTKETALKLKDLLSVFKNKLNDVAKKVDEDYNKQIEKLNGMSNTENK